MAASSSLSLPTSLAASTQPIKKAILNGSGKGKGSGKAKTQARQLTHFLCLPLVTESSRGQLGRSLECFREEVCLVKGGREEIAREKIDGKEIVGELESNGFASGSDGGLPGGDCGGGLDGGVAQVSEGIVRGDGLEFGIPPKAIRQLGSLHLTLGVMSLPTPTDVQRALEVLQGLNLPELLKKADPSSTSEASLGANKPLTISLKSLTSMHPPHKTSILYANPEDTSGRLLPFCQSLLNAFKEVPKENGEPLVVADTRPLLLHATIVNTIYAKSGRGGAGGQRGHGKFRGKITFDAKDVLEKYREYEWMRDVRIEKVAVCRMGAEKVVDGDGVETGDEVYAVEGEVDLP